MASGGVSLKGFNAVLKRLEQKFESIESRFEQLEEAAEQLSQRLEQHKQVLKQQTHQDQLWTFLLEESLTSHEINLFFSYTVDALRCCRSRLLAQLPRMAPALPSVASILRLMATNRQVATAWASTLAELGLHNSHIEALCAFLVTHGCKAEYCPPAQRQREGLHEHALIRRPLACQALRESLLRAVQVVEKGKAGDIASDTTEGHLVVFNDVT